MEFTPEFFEKRYSYDIDIFRHRLHVVVTTNVLASVNKHIRNSTRTTPIRAIHIVLASQGNSMIFIPFDVTPGEISHECMHCVQHIVEEIGASYKEDEFICYILGHLVDLVHNSLEKAKKKLDK